MNSLRSLAPKRDERGFLVGKTGSGKTTLAIQFLPLYRFVLAIDPKCTLGGKKGLEGFQLIRKPSALPGCKEPYIQLRPDPEYQNPDDWDIVYRWAFDRKNTFVYTDEAYLTLDGNRPTDGMRACVTSGRERGIGMLHCSQRPRGIPRFLYSESERFYAFQLGGLEDRKTMGEYMHFPSGSGVVEQPAKDHCFWYYYDRSGEGRYLKLPGDIAEGKRGTWKPSEAVPASGKEMVPYR